jgi:VanZ family protein
MGSFGMHLRERRLSVRNLLHHKVWIGIGWGLLAFFVTLSLLPNISVPNVGIVASDKAGHFLAYLTLTFWFCLVYERNAHYRIAGLLLALGMLVEILQWFSGYRMFEWADMAANASGIVVGWLLAGTRFARTLHWVESKL